MHGAYVRGLTSSYISAGLMAPDQQIGLVRLDSTQTAVTRGMCMSEQAK